MRGFNFVDVELRHCLLVPRDFSCILRCCIDFRDWNPVNGDCAILANRIDLLGWVDRLESDQPLECPLFANCLGVLVFPHKDWSIRVGR